MPSVEKTILASLDEKPISNSTPSPVKKSSKKKGFTERRFRKSEKWYVSECTRWTSFFTMRLVCWFHLTWNNLHYADLQCLHSSTRMLEDTLLFWKVAKNVKSESKKYILSVLQCMLHFFVAFPIRICQSSYVRLSAGSLIKPTINICFPDDLQAILQLYVINYRGLIDDLCWQGL